MHKSKLLQEILYYHFIPSHLSFYLSTQPLGMLGWMLDFSLVRCKT